MQIKKWGAYHQFPLALIAGMLFVGSGCTEIVSTIPPGDYATYAHSTTEEAIYSDHDDERTRVLPDVLEVHENYSTVFAKMAETQFNIPFGWYGIESGSVTKFGRTDDDYTRITLRIASLEGKSWNNFRDNFVADWLEAADGLVTAENMKLYPLSDTQFYTVLRHMTNDGGTENGAINLVTYVPGYPTEYHSVLLVTADAEVESYLGLVGLIARDMVIQWDTYK